MRTLIKTGASGFLVCVLVSGCLMNNSNQQEETLEPAPAEALAAADDRASASGIVTVFGRLIDTKCYGMNNENVENDHLAGEDGGTLPACATACANMTIPVGLLKDGQKGGEVAILLMPASQLADHMSKEARVTGKPTFDGGMMPEKIEVKNADGAWEEVPMATMM